MMSGCVSAQDGERFGVDIVGRISEPKLEYGVLISDDQKIRVEGVNAGINFGVEDGVLIPDEIEFLWRAAGEKIPHAQKMRLRNQIPSDVLQKTGGNFTTHYFSIEFFVLYNKPYFRWDLTEILPGQTSNFKKVARGGHW